jgi:hypothetical protein
VHTVPSNISRSRVQSVSFISLHAHRTSRPSSINSHTTALPSTSLPNLNLNLNFQQLFLELHSFHSELRSAASPSASADAAPAKFRKDRNPPDRRVRKVDRPSRGTTRSRPRPRNQPSSSPGLSIISKPGKRNHADDIHPIHIRPPRPPPSDARHPPPTTPHHTTAIYIIRC